MFGLETRTIVLSAHSTAADVSFEPRAGCFVLAGLEDAPTPVQIKFRDQVALAGKWVRPPLVVWVRSEDKADDSPPWLVSLAMWNCRAPAELLDRHLLVLNRRRARRH